MKTAHMLLLLVIVALSPPARADGAFGDAIAALTRAWDHAQFEVTGKDAQIAALQAVEAAARGLEQQYPDKAEPIALEAESLCSEAGVIGGHKALGLVIRAHKLFEKAEQINPNAFGDGTIYTNLGMLYYQVPGFPIAFGSRKRAREYLEQALAVNPNGIDPNYFMGEFQYREHHYEAAIGFLNRVLAAQDRPGREAADRGRRADAAILIADAQRKLH